MDEGGDEKRKRSHRVTRERKKREEVRPAWAVVLGGARGMMNIKAGQAVRVDSTLSARGAPRAKKKLRSILFMREARPRRLNRGGEGGSDEKGGGGGGGRHG